MMREARLKETWVKTSQEIVARGEGLSRYFKIPGIGRNLIRLDGAAGKAGNASIIRQELIIFFRAGIEGLV